MTTGTGSREILRSLRTGQASAWNMGYQAGRDGEPATTNPYTGEQDAEYWQNEYETAQDGVNELRAAIAKARDLISNQAPDITGAALDAWAILENAYPRSATD